MPPQDHLISGAVTAHRLSYHCAPVVEVMLVLVKWAQKSMQAVTPEKGRPSLQPRRQSIAISSLVTCVDCQGELLKRPEMNGPDLARGGQGHRGKDGGRRLRNTAVLYVGCRREVLWLKPLQGLLQLLGYLKSPFPHLRSAEVTGERNSSLLSRNQSRGHGGL